MPSYVKAPMPAQVIKVNVKPGDPVDEQTVVAVIEAMKMEMAVTADTKGIVNEVKVSEDQFVQREDTIVVID